VRAVRARFPDRLLVPDQGRVSLMQRPAHGGDGGHLTDHVLPPLPVRQWVLAVPKRLRYFISRDSHPSEM